MQKIGIVANPTSGKDIRRLVGQALVVGNREKVNIVKRVLIGAWAAGAREFMIMPDSFHIGEQCVHDLKNLFPDAAASVQVAQMLVEDTASDSTRAAQIMRAWGADCIVVLGGDGTVRVVDKGAKGLPLLPISTGTNNVIPEFIEGTVAGLAAGYFSTMPQEERAGMLDRQKRLEITVNGKVIDSALVDIAVVDGQHVGSRAVWDASQLMQVIVTRASPATIGISSIIGRYRSIAWDEARGASVIVRTDGKCYQVQAALGPGMIADICVDEYTEVQPGHPVKLIDKRPVVLALDGEREIVLVDGDEVGICLSMEGPNFLNYGKVLKHTQVLKE